MKQHRKSAAVLAAAFAGCLLSGTAAATPVSVFSTDFQSGVPAGFSGITTLIGTQGYSAHGFGSTMLRNASAAANGTGGSNTTLTLTGLQSHTSIDLNFLLAIINSWDDPGNPFRDVFNVRVDGVSIFSQSFSASGVGDQFTPQAGVALIENALLFTQSGDNSGFRDAAYNMGLQTSVFDNIAHTGSTLTIDFFATSSGVDGSGNGGWSGGLDESWGLDNVEVILNVPDAAAPEPASLGLMGLGLAAFVMGRRRRRG